MAVDNSLMKVVDNNPLKVADNNPLKVVDNNPSKVVDNNPLVVVARNDDDGAENAKVVVDNSQHLIGMGSADMGMDND